MLSRLASLLDTAGGRARQKRFRETRPGDAPVKFFMTRKVQYRYREHGEGSAIVFTVDPPATLEMYDALFDAFTPHFRVIALELPCMGFSAATMRYGFDFHETNDDVAEFLHAIAGPDAILAFSCVAGLAALDIASRHPDLASHLVLLQTTSWDGFTEWKSARDPKRILAKPFIGQLAMRALAAKRAPDWFGLVVGKRDMLPSFCACAEETQNEGALWALASAYQRYLFDGPSPLSPPAQPILLIWGAADRSHNADAIEHAKTVGENVKLVRWPDIGHFPELEAPDQVLGEVLRFVKERS